MGGTTKRIEAFKREDGSRTSKALWEKLAGLKDLILNGGRLGEVVVAGCNQGND